MTGLEKEKPFWKRKNHRDSKNRWLPGVKGGERDEKAKHRRSLRQ